MKIRKRLGKLFIDWANNFLREMGHEPLEIEHLKEMGGEPVYVQIGDGREGWAIVEWEGDNCLILTGYSLMEEELFFEPELDFINMEFALGWRAFKRKPRVKV